YSAAGNRAPSRMDDSCVFHRCSGRNDTTNRWSLFRDCPVYRTHTLRVLRYRVLDWFCTTPHRCGNLDSMDSTTGIQNIFVIFEKGNLPWRCLITSSFHRMTEKRRRSYWRTSSASSPANHLAFLGCLCQRDPYHRLYGRRQIRCAPLLFLGHGRRV